MDKQGDFLIMVRGLFDKNKVLIGIVGIVLNNNFTNTIIKDTLID